MPPPLDYAPRADVGQRSKFAIASCAASAVSGPAGYAFACLVGRGFFWPLVEFLLIFTAVGVYALVRVVHSHERMSGHRLAIGGIVLPVCWLVVIMLFIRLVA